MKIQLPGDVSSLPLLPTNSKVSSTSTVVVKRFTTTATSTELLPKYHPQDSSQNFAVDGILPTDLVDVWPAVLNVGSTMDDLLRQVMEAEQEAQGSRMMLSTPSTDMSCSPPESLHLPSLSPVTDSSDPSSVFSQTLTPKNHCAMTTRGGGGKALGCTVCTKPARHYHHGVVTCKACSLFFRRAVAAQRNYHCVKTDSPEPGNCDVSLGNCNACRLDRCLELGMKFETVKLPEGVAFGEVERQMRGRKKLLLLTKQQSSRSFENQRSSSVMGSSVRNIVVDESLLKTATAVEMIDHLELTRLVYIEDKFNRARLFLMSSNTLIRELYRKSLNEVVQDAGNLLGRIEASKLATRLQILYDAKPDEVFMMYPPPTQIMIDVFLSIETMKAMPVALMLDEDSRNKLARYIAYPLRLLCDAYYSWRKGWETIILPNGICPIIAMPRHLGQYDLPVLRRRVYCEPITLMQETQMTQEEYMFLRALIFSSFNAPDLSPYARRLLYGEARRYDRALMQHCQRRLGVEQGKRRHYELMLIVNKVFVFGALNAYFADHFIRKTTVCLRIPFLEECIGSVKIKEKWEEN